MLPTLPYELLLVEIDKVPIPRPTVDCQHTPVPFLIVSYFLLCSVLCSPILILNVRHWLAVTPFRARGFQRRIASGSSVFGPVQILGAPLFFCSNKLISNEATGVGLIGHFSSPFHEGVSDGVARGLPSRLFWQ